MLSLITNIQGYSIHDGPGIRTVVFLKGCSLTCRWCSNPECISAQPEIGFYNNLCTGCGKCEGACPAGALVCDGHKLQNIIRERCNSCGACVTACAYNALVLYGRPMNAEEIFNSIRRDKMFYQASGGGVTVSGGEALLQPELVCNIFEKCRREGIHTCIETSGYAPEAAFKHVIPLTDYILFDLKHMDPEKHRRYTGKTNDVILANAKIAAESRVETLFRMPLIPGINDDKPNIKHTADFLRGLGNRNERIELMPYHRLGKGKYESLGRRYSMPELPVPGPEHLEAIIKAFTENGINSTVSR